MRIHEVSGLMGAARVRVDLSPGLGLVALLGDGRARQAAQSLVLSVVAGGGRPRPRLIREARVSAFVPAQNETFELRPGAAHAQERRRLLRTLNLDRPSLALLWAGVADGSLGSVVDIGARLLALRSGLGRIEIVLDTLTRLPGVGEALDEAEARLGEAPAGLATGMTARARLARAERDLQLLRADAAEVHGDLDEATMEWLRERQDAETTLLAYRDRARELKARLHQMEHGGPGTGCPTCGRELEDQYDAVARELREEWESVVQDGQWWKRRHEQLEPKPERVRDLEGRAVRSQAAIEEAAERAEHVRTALRVESPQNGAPPRVSEPSGNPATALVGSIDNPRDTAVELASLARQINADARITLLSATSRKLNRLSGGRLIGLEAGDEFGAELIPRPVTGAPGTEDVTAALVSVHLALAATVGGHAAPLASLFVGERFSALEEEDQLRGVAILERMKRRFSQILVLPGSAVVDANPEAFDEVWEFRPVLEAGAPALRSLPVGIGEITIGA